jgi:hypothetical protein
MQSKSYFIVLIFGFAVSIFNFPSMALSNDSKKGHQTINSCIVKQISKCQSKFIMLSSNSDNLREYALLELRKAAFYTKEKDRLIEEMMEREVALKDYQVEYFLNRRFNELKK